MTARHCSTCDCIDDRPSDQPSTSSAWARRQALEAAEAAVRAAKDSRKKFSPMGPVPTSITSQFVDVWDSTTAGAPADRQD